MPDLPGTVAGTGASPDAPHTSTPQELSDRLAAERGEQPFLVYRDSDGRQVIVVLDPARRVTVGRRETNDLALPWDPLVSRSHAVLENVGGDWTVVDDGLSQNGTFLNGARVTRRVRLSDRDLVRIGQTLVLYRSSSDSGDSATGVDREAVNVADLSHAQRRVLGALVRPLVEGAGLRVPADNQQIADELVVSVETVKSTLKQLFARFALADAPRGEKRMRLAEIALRSGVTGAE